MTSLNIWKGFVDEKTDNSFFATIEDDDNNIEHVEIPLEKIELSEVPFIEEGAFFTWTVGVKCDQDYSNFVFSKRRWTQEELDSIKERGSSLYNKFNSSI